MTNAEKDNKAHAIDVVAGLVLAAMSLIGLFWLIPNYIEQGTSLHDVGPAFFPQLAATVVLGFSTILVVTNLARYKQNGFQDNSDLAGTSIIFETFVWLVISLLVIYGLSKVGFLVIAPLLIGLGAIASGYRIWWAVAVIAIIFPFVVDQAAWMIFTVDLP